MMATDPFASGVLDQSIHEMLVKNLDNYAHDAGIQKHWVWTALASTCTPEEVNYAKQFKLHAGKTSGLVYVGTKDSYDANARMSAIAGCLLRNFIRARVMTISSFLENGPATEIACVLIPNFFSTKVEGGSIAPWQVQHLLDYLLQRHIAGLQTVLYASDLDAMAKEYGVSVSKFVKLNYTPIKV